MKTTPTLGLKLYDGTDSPDLVSGYNASMSALDEKRLFRYLGTMQNSSIDLNNCHETGYLNNYDCDFTEANHGPVGSFNRGIIVVYDKCNGESAQGKCLRQEYYPEPYGTGDAYRPMVRTLNSDTATWTAWKPLVDVPEVPTWETLEGKPFSTVGKTLTTRDGALDLSTAAQASLVPAGGAAGQVLVKSSASDYDCEWMNPSALTNVLSLDSTYGLQQGGTLAPALQVRSPNESMVAMLASTPTVQCQQERNVYGALTAAGVTMRNAGGNTYYIIDGDGKGVLGNVGMLNNGAPVTQSTGSIAVSPSNTGGSDYSKFVGSALKAGKDYLGILETQSVVNGYTVFVYGCVVISMRAAFVTVTGTPVYNLTGKAVAVPMQIVCEYGGGTTVLLSEGSTEQFSTINITPIGNI